MFQSLIFPIFMGGVTVLFFLLPVKWRPTVLLLASYMFCIWIGMQTFIAVLFISFCTWIAGNKIEKALEKKQKAKGRGYLTIVIGFYIFVLLGYKYLLFPASVMPIGISFYLFQAIGYLIDIYKERIRAEKSFLYISFYLAFFPKLVSGPIEREQEFVPQVKAIEQVKFWDRGRLSTAFSYMLWGYFMKMVVADRLALVVNQIFGNPESFDSVWLAAGVLFYTMQIYCDFAGYSCIAVGCAGIFGIKLTQNFQVPYLADSISDFWHRWHISLSRWLRDYVYIPLGGNRKGIVRKCINTVIVFLVCGLWHGAGLNFLVWGFLHGIYSVIEVLCHKQGWKVKGGRVLTFAAVAFAWIFFRAGSLEEANCYIMEMCTSGIRIRKWAQMAGALSLNWMDMALIGTGIIVVWGVDELCNRKKMSLPLWIQQKQNAARYLFFYLLIIAIFIFGMYGPGYHAEQFIYMQF